MALTLPTGALPQGIYRLTISGTKAIFDVSGNKLAATAPPAPTISASSPSTAPPTSRRCRRHNRTRPPKTSPCRSPFRPLHRRAHLQHPHRPLHGTLSAIDPVTHKLTLHAEYLFLRDRQLRSSRSPTPTARPARRRFRSPSPRSISALSPPRKPWWSITTRAVSSCSAARYRNPRRQLVVTITSQPTHGTLTFVSGTTYSYAPAAGYVGADSFTFTVTDTGNPPGTASTKLTSLAGPSASTWSTPHGGGRRQLHHQAWLPTDHGGQQGRAGQ